MQRVAAFVLMGVECLDSALGMSLGRSGPGEAMVGVVEAVGGGADGRRVPLRPALPGQSVVVAHGVGQV
jgi:hypothetical protein